MNDMNEMNEMNDKNDMNDMSGMERLYALNDLRASLFDPAVSPRQHDYYVQLNRFYREQGCSSVAEATEMIKGTPFYDGLTKAKMSDDITLRARAMRDVRYDDAAAIHEERLQKLEQQGIVYCYTQEWLDDYQRVDRKVNAWGELKELFGRVYTGYIDLIGNPQKAHRDDAEKRIREALQEFVRRKLDFMRVASLPAVRKLTMLNDAGYKRFLTCIKQIAGGRSFSDDDVRATSEEQRRVAAWVRQNTDKLRAAGRSETWKRANCVAIPSKAPGGYDFVNLKETEI